MDINVIPRFMRDIQSPMLRARFLHQTPCLTCLGIEPGASSCRADVLITYVLTIDNCLDIYTNHRGTNHRSINHDPCISFHEQLINHISYISHMV